MKPVTLTIIGMGPRGLILLERLVQLVHQFEWRDAIRVELVDPGECGQGTHDETQPTHLLTNTLANQVTIFPPDSMAGGADAPSFIDWARRAGYRHFDGAFYPTGAPHGEELGEQHYLPRYLLGRYFSAAFDLVLKALPPNVRVHHHRRAARDVVPAPDGGFVVEVDGGAAFHTDYLFLTTGHGRRRADEADLRHAGFVQRLSSSNDKLDFFPHAYPVGQTSRISPDATVAIQGIGLTAHDVISHLTVGRGGRFSKRAGKLHYEPSGREPAMILFSRSGLPFSARAVNQKGAAGRYIPRFFTVEAIAALRKRAAQAAGPSSSSSSSRGASADGQRGQIDFVNDVMPLVMADMAYARHVALSGSAAPADPFAFDAQARAAIETILDPVRHRRFADLAEFRGFFRQFLVDDLAEVEKGNVKSPVKAATDVLRDVREQFRLAAEYGGFTPDSDKVFSGQFVNTLNRIVFGPPRHRNLELLALLDQGIVDLAGGPGATIHTDPQRAQFAIDTAFGTRTERRYADVLVVSRIDVFSPEQDQSELVARLLERGLIRGYRNGAFHPGGIDISPSNNTIGRDGTVNSRMWAIGYPVEGPHYYTQELPRPGRKSRATLDAEVCLQGLFKSLGASEPEPHTAAADGGSGAVSPSIAPIVV